MSLWEKVKVNLVEWYTVAADKTEEVTRVGMRRYDRFGISRDIERQLTELGSLVYNAHREGRDDVSGDTTFQAIIRRIEELEAELQRKEEEIEAIRRDAREARERKAAPRPAGEGAGAAAGAAGATETTAGDATAATAATGGTTPGGGERALEDPPGPETTARHEPSAGAWTETGPRPDTGGAPGRPADAAPAGPEPDQGPERPRWSENREQEDEDRPRTD